MMVKEMVGLVDSKRSFEKEYSALALSNEDYKSLQNDFRLFSCKIEQYKSLTENIAVLDNCPDNELLPDAIIRLYQVAMVKLPMK